MPPLLLFTQVGGFERQKWCFGLLWLGSFLSVDVSQCKFSWPFPQDYMMLNQPQAILSWKEPLNTGLNNNTWLRAGFWKALKQMGKPWNNLAGTVLGQRRMSPKLLSHVRVRTSVLLVFQSIALWEYSCLLYHWLLCCCHGKEYEDWNTTIEVGK